MSEVRVVMMSNGLELIGQVVDHYGSDEDYKITLKDILVIVLQPDVKAQRMGFNFMPYAPLTKSDTKSFLSKDITWIDEPADMLLSAWQEATGAVVTPPKSIVLN